MTPPVLTFARLTVLEAARRRLFWALVALTLVSVAITAWGVQQLLTLSAGHVTTAAEIALGTSQILILVAFMFSFVLAMTGAFLAAPAIAGDIESGIALTLVARPVRRSDLLFGRWLGLSLVVTGYAVGSGLLEIAAIGAVSGSMPPDPIASVLFLAGEANILLALTLLLSTRLSAIAGGAIAIIVFGLVWMLGVLGGVGAALGVDQLIRVADLSRVLVPTDLLWRGVVFGLQQPAAVLLAGGRAGRAFLANPFYAAAPPTPVAVAWAVAWVAIVLALAALSLRRREL